MKKNIMVGNNFCDVCEKDANGKGVSVAIYVNGEVRHEYDSLRHIDLCEEHTALLEKKWAQIPEKLLPDRYDKSYSESDKAEMVTLMKKWANEEEN